MPIKLGSSKQRVNISRYSPEKLQEMLDNPNTPKKVKSKINNYLNKKK